MAYNGNPDQDLKRLGDTPQSVVDALRRAAEAFCDDPNETPDPHETKSWDELRERVAALEAEIARLNEAGRVLAEVAYKQAYDAPCECDLDPLAQLDGRILNNPTAAAWVKEAANA